jgi:PKD repeat protein
MDELPEWTVSPPDLAALSVEDAALSTNRQRHRVASPTSIRRLGDRDDLDFERHAKWESLADGARLGRLRVSSRAAIFLSFKFSRFDLPPGAEMYFVSVERKFDIGPFDERHNKTTGRFGSPVVPGDSVLIELYLPPRARDFQLHIESVSYGYHDAFGMAGVPSRSGIASRDSEGAGAGGGFSCQRDINCPEGVPYQEIKHAMADGYDGEYVCSGQLLNNARRDGRYLYITASHCEWWRDPSTMSFYWDYENSGCDNDDNLPWTFSSGSTDLYHSTIWDGDVNLLELDGPDLQGRYDLYYLGWNRGPTPPTNSAMLSFPDGKPMQIVIDLDPSRDCARGCGGSSWGADWWRIEHWEHGVDEGGSSGGGLLDQDNLLVGVLTGGVGTDCDDFRWDEFYKLSGEWSELQPFLDPDSTGAMTVNGWDGVSDTPLELTACFTLSDGVESRAVRVDASCTFVPDGVNVSAYEWDFGDGASANGEVVEHSYEVAGNYTVTLVVRDNEGDDVSTTKPAALEDTRLELYPEDLILAVGVSSQLAAVAVGDFNFREDLTRAATGTVYTSDPAGVVSIDGDGLLTTTARGETAVTATNGELSDTTTVIVRDDLIRVFDSGFENPALADGGYTSSDGDYWKLGFYELGEDVSTWVPGGSDGGVWNPDAGDGFAGGAAFAGQNTGWAVSHVGFDAGLSQVLEATLQADTEYSLSVEVGNAFYNESDNTAPYRVELLAGGVLLASDSGDSPNAGAWELHSLIHDSGANPPQIGEALEIRLIAVEYVAPGGEDGYEVDFDEVSLTLSRSRDKGGPSLLRGDVDDNGWLEVTDAVRLLGFLFQVLPRPDCFDAADADDNGRLELTDAIRILGHLFQGSAPPPAPGPVECGEDPTDDELACEASSQCA